MQFLGRVYLVVLVAIGLALARGIHAQHVTAVMPSEPPAKPILKPEPRRHIAESPLGIFTDLSNGSDEARRRAFEQLGIDNSLESLEVDDVRLDMLNLDDDADLEAILLCTIGRRLTTAIVFDQSTDGWWQVGAFEYSWHWNSDTAERLIGFKEIVWPGRKELVVRQESGGTGAVRTDISVYRMHKGALYGVFSTNESREYDAVGRQNVSSYLERHDVAFYDADSAGRPAIVVRGTKTAYPADISARPRTEALGCVAYGWEPSKFLFSADSSLSTRLCEPDSK